MALRYCFEEDHVKATLARSKPSDLAVIDSDGISKSVIQAAVSRGVLVYDYINCGALENGRSYYSKYKHLRLARYDGWDGEYWINPTAKEWQDHCISLAKQIKATGAIGLYLDNTDIYYMCQQGFKEEKTKMLRSAPSAQAVYTALSRIILEIHKLGLIVMPNGGDTFVRKFISAHPRVIPTINQEGVFFEELNKKNKSADTQYYKDYCKWAQKRISGKVRIIEYTSSKTEQAKIKAYCIAHGWDIYFSKHKDLRGD